MPALNWIGKDAVVNHHKEVPFRLLKCNEKLSVGEESDIPSGCKPQPIAFALTLCELVNGRFLVVEYKGFDRWSDDNSKEKRAIGQVWEEKSDGHCLFVMPKGPDWNAILAKLGE